MGKLLLLGARVEGRVLDGGGVRWVGGLGGLEQLRAEVVAVLQSGGVRVVGALGGAGAGVVGNLEAWRVGREEEGKKEREEMGEGKEEEKAEEMVTGKE